MSFGSWIYSQTEGDLSKGGSELDIISRQFAFTANEMLTVSNRLKRAGYDEIAQEVKMLANTAEFFREEFDRLRRGG